jgi:hypothetical protein
MCESAPAQKCLAANKVRRTAPEVAPTAIMLIRFRVAINIIDETPADVWLILFPLRFDFGGVFFARITFLENGGSGALGGRTPTLSLSRFALDLRATMSWARP